MTAGAGALGDVALAPEYAARLSAENRRIVRICLLTMAALATASFVGVAFSLYLVEAAPLLYELAEDAAPRALDVAGAATLFNRVVAYVDRLGH